MKEFWDRTERQGDCLVWTGPVDTRGYGHLRFNGFITRAHRVAYQLSKGSIPAGEGHHGAVVMHTCDNRRCCNPAHLMLGTHVDNMADMAIKGRRKAINAGERNGRAVLTRFQVEQIKQDERSNRLAAIAFGVSKAAVQRIRAGKAWASA